MQMTQRPLAPAAALGEPSGTPAWKTIPSWYLLATQDRTIPPATQEFMAARAGSTVMERSPPPTSPCSPTRGRSTALVLDAVRTHADRRDACGGRSPGGARPVSDTPIPDRARGEPHARARLPGPVRRGGGRSVTEPRETERSVMLMLVALALGTFAIGTGEFGSNGIIQLFAADLDVSVPWPPTRSRRTPSASSSVHR